MNIRQTIRQAFLAGLMVTLLSGCVPEDSVEFSGDGTAGIAKIKDCLYLVDGKTGQMQQIADGDIQPFPSITPDGKLIAYCQEVTLANFSDAVKLLPKYQVEVIDYYARQMQQKIVSDKGLVDNKFPEITEGPLDKNEDYRDWVVRYLCEKADQQLSEVITAAEVEKGKSQPLKVTELIVAPVGSAQENQRRIVTASILTLWRPVLSPDQKYVAYLSYKDIKDEKDQGEIRYDLYLAQLQGDIGDILVADNVAYGFAWGPDSKAITYLQNSDKEQEVDFALGMLNTQLITDANNVLLVEPLAAQQPQGDKQQATPPELTSRRLSEQAKATPFALVLFNSEIKIAYGPGNRIFFSAAALDLPAGKLNYDSGWTIFCWDPETEAITDILPRGVSENLDGNVGYFALSPDGKSVLLPLPKTRFKIYRLGSEAAVSPIEETEEMGEKNALIMAPAWKGDTEICCMVSKDSHFLKDYTGEKQDQNLIIIDTKGEFRSILSMPQSQKK